MFVYGLLLVLLIVFLVFYLKKYNTIINLYLLNNFNEIKFNLKRKEIIENKFKQIFNLHETVKYIWSKNNYNNQFCIRLLNKNQSFESVFKITRSGWSFIENRNYIFINIVSLKSDYNIISIKMLFDETENKNIDYSNINIFIDYHSYNNLNFEYNQFNFIKIIDNPGLPILVFELPDNSELIKELNKNFY